MTRELVLAAAHATAPQQANAVGWIIIVVILALAACGFINWLRK